MKGNVEKNKSVGGGTSTDNAEKNALEVVSEYIPKVATRNLFIGIFQNANINSTGAFLEVTSGINFVAAPEFISVEGGKDYAFSWKKSSFSATLYVREYRSDYTFIKRNDNVPSISSKTFFTTQFDAECAYIRISLWGNYPDNSWEELIPQNFQIEAGNVATNYIAPQTISNEIIDIDAITEKMQVVKVFPFIETISVDNWELGVVDYLNGNESATDDSAANQWVRTKDYIPLCKDEIISCDYASDNVRLFEFDPFTLKLIVGDNDWDVSRRVVRNDCLARICVYKGGTEDFEPIINRVKIQRNTTNYILPKALPYIALHKMLQKNCSLKFDPYRFDLPVLEFNGDISEMTKDNAVTLTYKYGYIVNTVRKYREGSCTLKWQGSSSLAYPKKNYTVKFDTAFEAKSGWGEQNKYCLKANYIDITHSRNVCCAKLWGGVVKSRTLTNETLNALPNGGAIDGFPICVMVNEEYSGLYTFNIPKDGWMFGMGEGENEAIVCADGTSYPSCAFKGLATLDGDFDVEYAPNEDDTEWIKNSLNRLLQACIDCKSAEDFDNNVAQYLDVDSAIDYFLHVLAICNHDASVKNYLLATYDGVKWFFSAYDMDSVLGLTANGDGVTASGNRFLRESQYDLNGLVGTNDIYRLLKTYKADKLKARYEELTNGALSEQTVRETFTTFIGSIPKALYDEEVKIWTQIPNTSVNDLSHIIDFYRRRREFIDAQIEAL